MLKPLSNLTLDTRIEVKASTGLLLSGVTGTWAKLTTPATSSAGSLPTVDYNAGTADLPDAGGLAFPIWSESYRDVTQVGKWSPDVKATGQLTLIYGKYRAVTDQYDTNNAPAIGAKLYVNTAGKLTTVAGAGVVVAYCTKAPFSTFYLSTKFNNCIEFITA